MESCKCEDLGRMKTPQERRKNRKKEETKVKSGKYDLRRKKERKRLQEKEKHCVNDEIRDTNEITQNTVT